MGKAQTCSQGEGWLPTLAPPPVLTLAAETPPPPDIEGIWRAFYARYPRHVAPGAGKRALEAAIKASRVSGDELVRGADRYAEECRRRGTEQQFIAHPATWINAERWKDEYGSPIAASTAAFARAGAAYRDAADHRGGGVRGAYDHRGLDAADD